MSSPKNEENIFAKKKTSQSLGDYTMLSISEQLILVYCLIDDGLKSKKNEVQWGKFKSEKK